MQIDFAVSEADYLKADSLYRRQPHVLSDTMQFRAAQAFKTSNVARQEAYYRAYREQAKTPVFSFSFLMLHYQENPDVARRFAQLSQDKARTDEHRMAGGAVMSNIDTEQGRFRAGVERLRTLTLGRKTRFYADYANTPLSRIPRAQLEAM